MDHLCLQVHPWNEASIVEHLARHGMEVNEVGIRYGALGMGPSIYLQDPEGNTVELKGSAAP
jgi:catechol-2,3-dioxygenase